MQEKKYTFSSKVWLYPGHVGWHFANVPKENSREIRIKFRWLQRGWSSFPVEVKVGKSVWQTSIFFDKKSDTFLLPLKKEIRVKEEILCDDVLKISITLLI